MSDKEEIKEEVKKTIEYISNIVNLADEHINELLTEGLQGKVNIAAFSNEIAANLKIKQSDCFPIIRLHLSHRNDVLAKNGTFTKATNIINSTGLPRDSALKHYTIIKDDMVSVLEEEFKNSSRLDIKEICQKIADKTNKKAYVPYYCIQKLIEEEKQYRIDKGRNGGLFKLSTAVKG